MLAFPAESVKKVNEILRGSARHHQEGLREFRLNPFAKDPSLHEPPLAAIVVLPPAIFASVGPHHIVRAGICYLLAAETL